jgi:hypothetical protein
MRVSGTEGVRLRDRRTGVVPLLYGEEAILCILVLAAAEGLHLLVLHDELELAGHRQLARSDHLLERDRGPAAPAGVVVPLREHVPLLGGYRGHLWVGRRRCWRSGSDFVCSLRGKQWLSWVHFETRDPSNLLGHLHLAATFAPQHQGRMTLMLLAELLIVEIEPRRIRCRRQLVIDWGEQVGGVGSGFIQLELTEALAVKGLHKVPDVRLLAANRILGRANGH